MDEAGKSNHGPLGRAGSLLRFAWNCRGSYAAFARLFYLTALKPGLVYRHMARFHPERLFCLPLKLAGRELWQVHVRDNGQDAGMLAEFFQGQHLFEARSLPSEPQVIFDLGANIGIASLFLASVCPGARICGFEPVPGHFELCRRNYLNLQRAQAFNCAVGRSSGSQTFEFSQSDIRGGHLAGDKTRQADAGTSTFAVEVWSLEDLVRKKNLPPPDFLKIDVEGAELEVLEGLGAPGESVKYIHLETHSVELKEQCLRWLLLKNFEIAAKESYTEQLGALWAIRRAAG